MLSYFFREKCSFLSFENKFPVGCSISFHQSRMQRTKPEETGKHMTTNEHNADEPNKCKEKYLWNCSTHCGWQPFAWIGVLPQLDVNLNISPRETRFPSLKQLLLTQSGYVCLLPSKWDAPSPSWCWLRGSRVTPSTVGGWKLGRSSPSKSSSNSSEGGGYAGEDLHWQFVLLDPEDPNENSFLACSCKAQSNPTWVTGVLVKELCWILDINQLRWL